MIYQCLGSNILLVIHRCRDLFPAYLPYLEEDGEVQGTLLNECVIKGTPDHDIGRGGAIGRSVRLYYIILI